MAQAKSAPESDPVGIVLAGGRSRRMGTDKATLSWPSDGGTLSWLDHARRRLNTLCADVVVSGNTSLPDTDDSRPGPLAGFCAALHQYPGRVCLFLPVDMPLVPVGELQRLAQSERPHACYADSLFPLRITADEPASQAVQGCLAATDPRHRSVKALLSRLSGLVTLQPLDPALMVNANTPEDLVRIGLTDTYTSSFTGEQSL